MNLSMCRGGARRRCSTSRSMFIVMRVGHLESNMVWRSLLYPSAAKLPLVWGITQLPLPIPHDLPTAELVASAKWLVRALLTENPGAAHPFLPEWIQLGEAQPTPPCWSLANRGFIGQDEAGHGRSTVGLTRARGTIILGPPDPYPYGLTGLVQTFFCLVRLSQLIAVGHR